jgi:ABC-type polysaccharide/polyol phosphate export permease
MIGEAAVSGAAELGAPPTYDSSSRRSRAISQLVDLFRYRDLLLILTANITKTRYRRSAIGVAWTLLNPLATMGVLTFAFSHVFRFSLASYPVYVLTGLICWNFFAQTTTHAMNTMIWGSGLLKRVYLPRAIFTAASIGNGVLNLALALIPLAAIMLAVRHPVSPVCLFVPVAVALLVLFAFGVALLVSTFAALWVDVAEMYGVILQMWFFLTPVMYPETILPPGLRRFLELNPMVHLLRLFRAPLYDGELPSLAALALGAAIALATVVAGWLVFAARSEELAMRV